MSLVIGETLPHTMGEADDDLLAAVRLARRTAAAALKQRPRTSNFREARFTLEEIEHFLKRAESLARYLAGEDPEEGGTAGTSNTQHPTPNIQSKETHP